MVCFGQSVKGELKSVSVFLHLGLAYASAWSLQTILSIFWRKLSIFCLRLTEFESLSKEQKRMAPYSVNSPILWYQHGSSIKRALTLPRLSTISRNYWTKCMVLQGLEIKIAQHRWVQTFILKPGPAVSPLLCPWKDLEEQRCPSATGSTTSCPVSDRLWRGRWIRSL